MDQLPEDSATWSSLRDNLTPEEVEQQQALETATKKRHGRWSRTDMLVAAVADAVERNSYYFISANTDKGKRPKEPTPIPRPGVEDKSSKPRGISDVQRDYLERLRKKRGAA